MLAAEGFDFGVKSEADEGGMGGGGKDQRVKAHAADHLAMGHQPYQIGRAEMRQNTVVFPDGEPLAEQHVLLGIEGNKHQLYSLGAEGTEPGDQKLAHACARCALGGDDGEAVIQGIVAKKKLDALRRCGGSGIGEVLFAVQWRVLSQQLLCQLERRTVSQADVVAPTERVSQDAFSEMSGGGMDAVCPKLHARAVAFGKADERGVVAERAQTGDVL